MEQNSRTHVQEQDSGWYLPDGTPITHRRPLRLVELFSGIGAQAQALSELGVPYTSVCCEIDDRVHTLYEAVHCRTPNLGDITKVAELPECDVMTYSFPCIRGDQRVHTERGLVPMRDVRVGDRVLTHKGRFRQVTAHAMTGIHGTMSVRTSAGTVVCTRDHMILTRYNLGNSGHTRCRTFTEAYWAPAVTLVPGRSYIGYPIITEERDIEWSYSRTLSDGRVRRGFRLSPRLRDPDFWWLCGRYVADGWLRSDGSGVVIAVGKGKRGDVERIRSVFNGTVSEERTAIKVHVCSVELMRFCDEMFGHGADSKFIDQRVKMLPVGLLRAFLEGYLSGDGSYNNGWWSCNSVSERLMRDMQEVIMKVHRRPVTYYVSNRGGTCVIEGRTVNTKPSHNLRWKENANKQDKMFTENGIVWYPVKSAEMLNPTQVYDITVEEDESFVAEGIIVHNCQSLSSAGARGGLEEGSGTASSLVWEVMRLLRDTPPEKRPQALVMENVEMLVSERFMPSFLKVQAELTALGYTNVWAKRSAVTDGLPQRRVRVFMVSLRGGRTYTFPAGSVRCPPLSSLLEDVPEGSAERRVMTENAKAKYREWLRSHGVTEAGDGFMRYPCATRRGYTIARKGDGLVWARCHRARGTVQNAVSPTLTTGAGCGVGVWADGPPSLDSVRMLTPREAWRLMGFPDDAYDDAVMTGASPAQLYSAAGNSIAVPVLASIFRELLRGGHSRQTTLDIYDKEEEG